MSLDPETAALDSSENRESNTKVDGAAGAGVDGIAGVDGAVDDAQVKRPTLRIVKGNPTAEEIAALVAVFSAVGGETIEEPELVSAWASPAALHRASLPVGAPNAWVLSGR